MGSESRQRTKLYPVRFFPEEFAEAERKAQAFSYSSVAALVRDLINDIEPTSTLDQQAIIELAKINGDLGRLGGLLKHWLQKKGATPGQAIDIRGLLKDIQHTQAQLAARIKTL